MRNVCGKSSILSKSMALIASAVAFASAVGIGIRESNPVRTAKDFRSLSGEVAGKPTGKPQTDIKVEMIVPTSGSAGQTSSLLNIESPAEAVESGGWLKARRQPRGILEKFIDKQIGSKHVSYVIPALNPEFSEVYRNFYDKLPLLVARVLKKDDQEKDHIEKIKVAIIEESNPVAVFVKTGEHGERVLLLTSGLLAKEANDHRLAYRAARAIESGAMPMGKALLIVKGWMAVPAGKYNEDVWTRSTVDPRVEAAEVAGNAAIIRMRHGGFDPYEAVEVETDLAHQEAADPLRRVKSGPTALDRKRGINAALAVAIDAAGKQIEKGKASNPLNEVVTAASAEWFASEDFKKNRDEQFENAKKQVEAVIEKTYQLVKESKLPSEISSFQDLSRALEAEYRRLYPIDGDPVNAAKQVLKVYEDLDRSFDSIRVKVLGEGFTPTDLDQYELITAFEKRISPEVNFDRMARYFDRRRQVKNSITLSTLGIKKREKEEIEVLKEEAKSLDRWIDAERQMLDKKFGTSAAFKFYDALKSNRIWGVRHLLKIPAFFTEMYLGRHEALKPKQLLVEATHAKYLSGLKGKIVEHLQKVAASEDAAQLINEFQSTRELLDRLSKADRKAIGVDVFKILKQQLDAYHSLPWSNPEKTLHGTKVITFMYALPTEIAAAARDPRYKEVVPDYEKFRADLFRFALTQSIQTGFVPPVPKTNWRAVHFFSRLVSPRLGFINSILGDLGKAWNVFFLGPKDIGKVFTPEFTASYLAHYLRAQAPYDKMDAAARDSFDEILKKLDPTIPGSREVKDISGGAMKALAGDALGNFARESEVKPTFSVEAMEGIPDKFESMTRHLPEAERTKLRGIFLNATQLQFDALARESIQSLHQVFGFELTQKEASAFLMPKAPKYLSFVTKDGGKLADDFLPTIKALSKRVQDEKRTVDVYDPFELFENLKKAGQSPDQAFALFEELAPLMGGRNNNRKTTVAEVQFYRDWVKWVKKNRPKNLGQVAELYSSSRIDDLRSHKGFGNVRVRELIRLFQVEADEFYSAELRKHLPFDPARATPRTIAEGIMAYQRFLAVGGSRFAYRESDREEMLKFFKRRGMPFRDKLEVLQGLQQANEVFVTEVESATGRKPAKSAIFEAQALLLGDWFEEIPKDLTKAEKIQLAEVFGNFLHAGKKYEGANLDHIFNEIFDVIQSEPHLGKLFLDPSLPSQLYYDSNKTKLAKWQLHQLYDLKEIAKERLRPNRWRSEFRQIVNTMKHQLSGENWHDPTPSVAGNLLIKEIEEALQPTAAETAMLDTFRLDEKSIAKDSRIKVMEIMRVGNEFLAAPADRIALIEFVIGRTKELPLKVRSKLGEYYRESLLSAGIDANVLRKLDQEMKKGSFWKHMQAEFKDVPAPLRVWPLEAFASPHEKQSSKAQLESYREQIFKIILGENSQNQLIRKMMDAYFEAVQEKGNSAHVNNLIAYVLGTFPDSKEGTQRASLARILEAMGPFGIKAGQFLRNSGLLEPALRAELEHFLSKVDPPHRGEIMRRIQEAFPDFEHIVWIGELKGSGSINYIVRADVRNPVDGKLYRTVLRFQRLEAQGRVLNQNHYWANVEKKLLEDTSNPESLRYGAVVRVARRNAMNTLEPTGSEMDASFDESVHENVKRSYQTEVPDMVTGLKVDVTKPLSWLNRLIKPRMTPDADYEHGRNQLQLVAAFEAIDFVDLNDITNELLAEHGITGIDAGFYKANLIRQRFESEFAALFDKGEFDPDSHNGNWLIDLANKRQVRIDTSQLRKFEGQDKESFREVLKSLINPEINETDADLIASKFFDLHYLEESKPGPAVDMDVLKSKVAEAIKMKEFPSPLSPAERLDFIRDYVQKAMFRGEGDSRLVGLKDQVGGAFALLARMAGYQDRINDLVLTGQIDPWMSNLFGMSLAEKLGLDGTEFLAKMERSGYKFDFTTQPDAQSKTVEEAVKQSCFGRTIGKCKDFAYENWVKLREKSGKVLTPVGHKMADAGVAVREGVGRQILHIPYNSIIFSPLAAVVGGWIAVVKTTSYLGEKHMEKVCQPDAKGNILPKYRKRCDAWNRVKAEKARPGLIKRAYYKISGKTAKSTTEPTSSSAVPPSVVVPKDDDAAQAKKPNRVTTAVKKTWDKAKNFATNTVDKVKTKFKKDAPACKKNPDGTSTPAGCSVSALVPSGK